MHICNAMQLLETKKKKKTKKQKNQGTKNNGHKGKTMKHKDKEGKTDQGHRITPITLRRVSNLLLSRGLVKMSTF